MSEIESIEPSRRRGIYLLPNLFTTTALFFGFYAIIAATQNKFEYASIALFVAMIMDGLDGRVARMTHTQSAFGAQYDSLSDMVCFGLAPSLVVYNWGLSSLGKLGWLAAFLYTAATALRLARFNTQLGASPKNFFIGLPCPAAAAVIAGMVWAGTDFGIPGKRISELMAVITVMLSLLMVCNLRYYSFKEIDFKENVPFFSLLMIVWIYSLIAWDPPKVLCIMFLSYLTFGPIVWVKDKFKKQFPAHASEGQGKDKSTKSAKNTKNIQEIR